MNDHARPLIEGTSIQRPHISARGISCALLTVLCWASAFPAIRVAVRSFSPVELAFLRALAAMLGLGLMGWVRGMGFPRVCDLPAFAALGLGGHALYTALLSQGQIRVPAATAAFLVASTPAWMALLGRISGQTRISPQAWMGLAISLGGVSVITLARGGSLRLQTSALFILAAALLQAVYSLGQRPLLSRYSGLQIVTHSMAFACLGFMPFGCSALGRSAHVPFHASACALFLGLVPSALGYWAWAETHRHLPLEAAGAFLYLVPGVVLLIAWRLLGEAISPLALLGGVLILAGVFLVQGNRSRNSHIPSRRLP